MRLYSFVNANLLKHVQHGIQTAHCVSELYNKYPEKEDIHYKLLNDWARNHKTIIILDGGDCQDLIEIKEFLDNNLDLGLPYSYFNENKRFANEALTAVSVIVPREIYDVKVSPPIYNIDKCTTTLDFNPHTWPTSTEEALYKLLKSKSLAR